MLRAAPLLLVIACATVPHDAHSLARSQTMMREAVALGAERVPTARLHLQRASERLERTGGQEPLDLDLVQADAELAFSLAQEAAIRRERVDAQRELARLGGAR
ncbi:MAG: hypothetical protein JNK82_42055 [Myxococcaceae bacterium]|nr:hypothetical protein [Myxococcaceae bacterium]